MNSYFDNNVVKKAQKTDFTSSAAKEQLNAIFGNSKADHFSSKVQTMQKKSVSHNSRANAPQITALSARPQMCQNADTASAPADLVFCMESRTVLPSKYRTHSRLKRGGVRLFTHALKERRRAGTPNFGGSSRS